MLIRGLYALTPGGINDADLLAQVAAAVSGGVRLLQYRNKNADAPTRTRQATQLAAYCRQQQVCFIVNDDVALAQQCGADGVHLGRSDRSIATARQQLGARMLIGSTCHNSLDDAAQAQAAGADYLAFGAVYPSATKPDAGGCPLATITRARQQTTLPIVAIGGITVENAAAVIAAGADCLAVSQGLFADTSTAAINPVTTTAATAIAFSQLFAHAS
ncbi:MAG: thiamine phosphate synthase [Proteobacteria bacterium]|nr:thiamine phosphate synthase [Pseudomonadota bacterium]